jgi:hypothetical protein
MLTNASIAVRAERVPILLRIFSHIRKSVWVRKSTCRPASEHIAPQNILVTSYGVAKFVQRASDQPELARYLKLELEQDTGGTWWRIDELRVLQ